MNGFREWIAGSWDAEDVLDSLWRVIGSPYVTACLVLFLAVASALRLALPQKPLQALDNPAALSAWLVSLHGQYPRAADWLVRLGLDDISHAVWYRSSFGLLALNLLLRLASYLNPLPRLAWPTLDRAVQFVAESDEPVESMASRLKEVLRVERYRTVSRSQWICADRFAYSTLLGVVALVLVLAGAIVSERTSWWEDNVPLRPGQLRPLGHGTSIAVRSEEPDQASGEKSLFVGDRVELSFLQGSREMARRVVTAPWPTLYRGLFLQHLKSELALLVRAQNHTDASLTLQRPETGETRFTQVALSFREEAAPRYIVVLGPEANTSGRSFEQRGNEQYVIVPDRDLSLRIVYETLGPAEAAFHIEAFRGNAATPFFTEQFAHASTLTIEGDRYIFIPQQVALIRFGQDYGVFVSVAGAALAVIALVLWLGRRPRRAWFLLGSDGDRVRLYLLADSPGSQQSPWFSELARRVSDSLGLTCEPVAETDC